MCDHKVVACSFHGRCSFALLCPSNKQKDSSRHSLHLALFSDDDKLHTCATFPLFIPCRDRKATQYADRDVLLTLPSAISATELKWLSMFCISYSHNFGEVTFPDDLNVPPHIGQIGERICFSAICGLQLQFAAQITFQRCILISFSSVA